MIRLLPLLDSDREKARDALAAYADGADFNATIARLAEVGRVMEIMLG